MLTTMRTSRKSGFFFVFAVFFIVVLFFAFKDMHEKLNVMTGSNAAYRKMTDSQASKIKGFVAELADLKEMHKKELELHNDANSELRTKLAKSKKDLLALSEVEKSLKKCRSEFDTLSKNHLQQAEDMNRIENDMGDLKKNHNSELRQKDSQIVELRDQLARISIDRDNFKRQYLALFKQDQDNSDKINTLMKEKERLDIQLQDAMSQKVSRQQLQVSPSSKVSPIAIIPDAHKGASFPMSTSVKDHQAPQVNLEDPSGNLQGKPSLSSTTVAAKQQQEGVAIAQPPVEGDPQSPGDGRAMGPKQGEVVEQVAREDVMEAPGIPDRQQVINLQPDVIQSRFVQPVHQREDNRHHPLAQPRQHQDYFRDPYPQQFAQQLPYLQQQQNLLQKYQVQPQNPQFPKKNIRGKNLDEEVDDFQLGNFGNQFGDDYDGDDAADGQLENRHYPVKQLRVKNKVNDIEYVDGGHVKNYPKQGPKNNYIQNNPVVYGDKNRQAPIHYMAHPLQQQYGRAGGDFN